MFFTLLDINFKHFTADKPPIYPGLSLSLEIQGGLVGEGGGGGSLHASHYWCSMVRLATSLYGYQLAIQLP